MALRRNAPVVNTVESIVVRLLLPDRVVANVHHAEVGDKAEADVSPQEVLVRKMVLDMGIRVADLPAMPQAENSGQ